MGYCEIWAKLSKIDVSSHIEKKMNLSYLSWAWAWGVLMDSYPEATYEFLTPDHHQDGTVTVFCQINIGECSRTMWLPVMDHKNNAIPTPDARKISDAKMRCLVKCMAMYGLGHYIYAGEDLPEQKSPDEIRRELFEKYKDIITTIKDGICGDDEAIKRASQAWFILHESIKQELWLAQSKGGVFTASEKATMQSSEFRKAGQLGE